jgi:hypothetical protein
MVNNVFICPTCMNGSHGQYGLLYVILVLRTVVVKKFFNMSYLYQGQSWSIRFFIYHICIKESHGQEGLLCVLLALMKVMANKVFNMSYLY